MNNQQLFMRTVMIFQNFFLNLAEVYFVISQEDSKGNRQTNHYSLVEQKAQNQKCLFSGTSPKELILSNKNEW